MLSLARAIVTLARRLPRPPRDLALRHRQYPPAGILRRLRYPGAWAWPHVLCHAGADRPDHHPRTALAGIPDNAPAFFFLDVRNEELPAFGEAATKFDGVKDVANAPMLRGRIARIGDTPADKVQSQGDSGWALRGDRGLTYSETLPEGSMLVEGEWWEKDYNGPPLVSFVNEVARDIGLKIGDSVTVNVLGREITAQVANFREVNWRTWASISSWYSRPTLEVRSPIAMSSPLRWKAATRQDC